MTSSTLIETQTEDPDYFSEVPLDARRIMRRGILILALCFGGFMVWSSVAELTSGAVAPGVVAVSSNRKTIDHLDGGIVREIAVQEGDFVQAGDLLVRLDDVEAKAQFDILRTLYAAAVAEADRLKAERDGLGFGEQKALLSELATDEIAQAAVTGQLAIHKAREDVRDLRVTILEKRIAQLKEQQTAYAAQLSGEEKTIALLGKEVEALRRAFQQGHITRDKLFSLETDLARAVAQRDSLRATQTGVMQQIAEAEAQILQVNADYQDDVTTKLSRSADKIADLRERLTTARQRLNRAAITAPVSGEIVGLRVHTIGASIRPSDPIMDIVPSEDRLLIEAQLSTADIERVSVSQEAEVRFITLPRTMPALNGRVETVSADRMMDAQQRHAYYMLKVGVDEKELARLGAKRIHPGMPVEVMVKTGERTVLGYLLDPLVNALGRTFREE